MPISTWANQSTFEYTGCVAIGTTIMFGTNRQAIVTTEQYEALRNHFLGRVIPAGTDFQNPPPDSIGEWLLQHVSKTALASYVAPILIREGYAIKETDTELRIIR